MGPTLFWIPTVIHSIHLFLNVSEDCQIIQVEPVSSAVIKRLTMIPFRDVLILGKSEAFERYIQLKDSIFSRAGETPTFPSGWLDREIFDGITSCIP